jgi:hypothetical protein
MNRQWFASMLESGNGRLDACRWGIIKLPLTVTPDFGGRRERTPMDSPEVNCPLGSDITRTTVTQRIYYIFNVHIYMMY